MNKVKNLQEIRSNKQSKYDEIIEYLSQDNRYWLDNDIWNIEDGVFNDIEYKVNSKNIKLDFIKNTILKNEIKYYLVYSFKNKYISLSAILNEYQYAIKYLNQYMETYLPDNISFVDVNIESIKWKIFMIQNGFKTKSNGTLSCNGMYREMYHLISDFIKDFYDDREET